MVLVEVSRDIGAGRSSRTLATGVVLEGGRTIATAGHALSNAQDADRVRVRPSGRTEDMDVAVTEVRFERLSIDSVDLGFAELATPVDVPVVEIGVPEVGALLVGLSFPEGIGVTDSGSLQHARPDGAPLQPIPVIVEVLSVEPLRLGLVAGSMPLRGASGSPFFDRDGRCVGILSSVEATYANDESSSFSIAASPLRSRPAPDAR